MRKVSINNINHSFVKSGYQLNGSWFCFLFWEKQGCSNN